MDRFGRTRRSKKADNDDPGGGLATAPGRAAPRPSPRAAPPTGTARSAAPSAGDGRHARHLEARGEFTENLRLQALLRRMKTFRDYGPGRGILAALPGAHAASTPPQSHRFCRVGSLCRGAGVPWLRGWSRRCPGARRPGDRVRRHVRGPFERELQRAPSSRQRALSPARSLRDGLLVVPVAPRGCRDRQPDRGVRRGDEGVACVPDAGHRGVRSADRWRAQGRRVLRGRLAVRERRMRWRAGLRDVHRRSAQGSAVRRRSLRVGHGMRNGGRRSDLHRLDEGGRRRLVQRTDPQMPRGHSVRRSGAPLRAPGRTGRSVRFDVGLRARARLFRLAGGLSKARRSPHAVRRRRSMRARSRVRRVDAHVLSRLLGRRRSAMQRRDALPRRCVPAHARLLRSRRSLPHCHFRRATVQSQQCCGDLRHLLGMHERDMPPTGKRGLRMMGLQQLAQGKGAPHATFDVPPKKRRGFVHRMRAVRCPGDATGKRAC